APGGGKLAAFGSCPAFLGYVKSHAVPFVTAYGFGQSWRTALPGVPTPMATGSEKGRSVDYSGTNVQEAGVDEPDLVKTNGRTLFAISGTQLDAVDVTGAAPKLLDTLTLDSGWSHVLLLRGTPLLILPRGGYWIDPHLARP